MKVYDSTLCCVCSHLAAHQNNVAGRNSDYANILAKVEFRNELVAERCVPAAASAAAPCCFTGWLAVSAALAVSALCALPSLMSR